MTRTPTTDEWGIDASWLDALDEEHQVSEATIERLREVIGVPPADLEDRAPIVARPGDALEIDEAEVTLEDGSTRHVDGELPDDFPLGYHWLQAPGGPRRRLVVSPGRCWLPDDRAWGWAVQLYATRSRSSWGIGDLADLRAVREMAADQGAGFVLINPLHAVAPTPQQEASPYLPATRRFRNPVYLRVEEVPGADGVDLDGEAGRSLNDGELIDRDAIWARKREALRRVFDAAGRDDPAFPDWWWHQGQKLQDWATWCALADVHGPDWHTWPEELRDPRSDAVGDFVAGHERDVAFHAWLQWCLSLQLERATEGMTVIQDLPIGVAGGGADAWTWMTVMPSVARSSCRDTHHCSQAWKATSRSCSATNRPTSSLRGSRSASGHVCQSGPCRSASAHQVAQSCSFCPWCHHQSGKAGSSRPVASKTRRSTSRLCAQTASRSTSSPSDSARPASASTSTRSAPGTSGTRRYSGLRNRRVAGR